MILSKIFQTKYEIARMIEEYSDIHNERKQVFENLLRCNMNATKDLLNDKSEYDFYLEAELAQNALCIDLNKKKYNEVNVIDFLFLFEIISLANGYYPQTCLISSKELCERINQLMDNDAIRKYISDKEFLLKYFNEKSLKIEEIKDFEIEIVRSIYGGSTKIVRFDLFLSYVQNYEVNTKSNYQVV